MNHEVPFGRRPHIAYPYRHGSSSLIARSVAALRKRGRPSSKGKGDDEADKEEGARSKAKIDGRVLQGPYGKMTCFYPLLSYTE